MIYLDYTATDVNDSAVLYRNVLGEGTLAWSSQTVDGSAANALGPQTYDYWTPAVMPATLSVTLAAPVECDTAAILGHTLGTAGAAVYIEWYDGTAWVAAFSIVPTNDRDIVVLFGGQLSAQWRLRITGATAPSIGIVMIGPRLLVPGGVVDGYIPTNLSKTVELSPSITIQGQYVGTFVQRLGTTTSITLTQQRRDWIEGDARPFIDHFNQGSPFVWMGCPALLPDDMAYCWRSGQTLTASYGPGAVWGEMSMEVQGYNG